MTDHAEDPMTPETQPSLMTSILLDHEPVADGGGKVRVLLRLEGTSSGADDRTPLNLCLVVDRSGSMIGEKLDAAREAAVRLVRRLSPRDTVSVVAYDQEVEVIAPPATGSEQRDLVDRIRGITTGGTTNLSGAWLRARDLVGTGPAGGSVRRIILLTDGLANEGITDPVALIALAGAGADDGVATTTVGFGADFDEDLLHAMADAGRGATYYVERPDQAGGIFAEELDGLTSLVAQNVRVGVDPGSHADFVQVVHPYPSHAEGNVLTVEVGDVFARDPRRLLMEFLLHHDAADVEAADVATLTVTADALTGGGGIERLTLTLPVTLSPTEGGQVHPDVRREVVLLEAAQARRAALDARADGDWLGARASLEDAVRHARRMGLEDPEVAEELTDLSHSIQAFEARSVSEADIKYMKQRAYSTERSRRSGLRRFRRESDDVG